MQQMKLRPMTDGDRAEVVPEAPLDQPRSARVEIVDPVIDGASATFGAILLLPNADRRLPAGLRCRVALDSEAHPATARANSESASADPG